MSDLLERLRNVDKLDDFARAEAADEIERLRKLFMASDKVGWDLWKAQAAENERLRELAAEMLEALRIVEPLMIPGMTWADETGQLIKSIVREAIANAGGLPVTSAQGEGRS